MILQDLFLPYTLGYWRRKIHRWDQNNASIAWTYERFTEHVAHSNEYIFIPALGAKLNWADKADKPPLDDDVIVCVFYKKVNEKQFLTSSGPVSTFHWNRRNHSYSIVEFAIMSPYKEHTVMINEAELFY